MFWKAEVFTWSTKLSTVEPINYWNGWQIKQHQVYYQDEISVPYLKPILVNGNDNYISGVFKMKKN